jgi:hypothetical protein
MNTMKNLINKCLLLIVLAVVSFSCVEDEGGPSTITTLEEFTVVASSVTSFGEVVEDGSIYTVKFLFDSDQILDLTLLVQQGPSSVAKIDEDFIILNDHIDVDAFTSDSISVDIQILSDFAPEEDEAIFLQFVGELGDPRPLEVQVGTILDNGLTSEPPATSIDFQLSWFFDDPLLASADVCGIIEDMDFIINTAFSYTGDLFPGNEASTLACPESGTIAVADMVEGVVYSMYVVVYGGLDLGPTGAMTVQVDFDRAVSTLSGAFQVGGFDSILNGQGGAIATIVRNGDVVTVNDLGGGVISEGRAHFEMPDGAFSEVSDSIK